MRYIKIFENFNRFERDDTDKKLHSNWKNKLYTTVRSDNYECIKKYCGIDSDDISNIFTDLLDEYSNLHFECAFYFDHNNLFTVYLYDPTNSLIRIEDYPKIKEFSEDINNKLEDYGLKSKYKFSNKGNDMSNGEESIMDTQGSYLSRCYKFHISKKL